MKIAILLLVLTMTGCAALQTTVDVLDIFFPPDPVCDAESIGMPMTITRFA